MKAQGGTAILDGLMESMKLFQNAEGRRVVIVITDGQPTAYFLRGRLYCEWPLSFGGISMHAAQETLCLLDDDVGVGVAELMSGCNAAAQEGDFHWRRKLRHGQPQSTGCSLQRNNTLNRALAIGRLADNVRPLIVLQCPSQHLRGRGGVPIHQHRQRHQKRRHVVRARSAIQTPDRGAGRVDQRHSFWQE